MQSAFLSIPYRGSYCMPANVSVKCWGNIRLSAGRDKHHGPKLLDDPSNEGHLTSEHRSQEQNGDEGLKLY